MATYSSILAWRIPWREDPVGYSPWGCKESGIAEQLTLSRVSASSFFSIKTTRRFSGAHVRFYETKALGMY